MRWKRSTLWAAWGISQATPREYALSHVTGELGECPTATEVLIELVAEPACTPLSLPCAAAMTLVAVEVCHRAGVGLVAPAGRVVDPHAADTRVVGGTSGLKGGPVPRLTRRVKSNLRTCSAIALTLMPQRA